MYDLPNFEHAKKLGSHATFIQNVFPTLTFTNHFSLATGLYAESHGILNNEMHDTKLNKTFHHTIRESQTLDWYGQNDLIEPIWLANQKRGIGQRRSAIDWPGAPVKFKNDMQIIKYSFSANTTKTLENSKASLNRFLDLFMHKNDPINFAA
jgi:predicted AlkP superfamily pyrophosphatase or phosphodiesterase